MAGRPVELDIDILDPRHFKRVENAGRSHRGLPGLIVSPFLQRRTVDRSPGRKAAACKTEQCSEIRVGKRL